MTQLPFRFLGALFCLGVDLISPVAQAGNPETLLLLTNPLDLELLNPDNLPADGSVVTPDTISQTGLTIPSLWWAREQFGGDLLSYWFAFAGTETTPARVDLLVNPQTWNNASYVQRYAFVNHFGVAARDFGYSTRIFNPQGNLLGAYICDFDRLPTPAVTVSPPVNTGANSKQANAPAATLPPACQVFLDPSGASALRGTTPFGEL